MDNNLNTLKKFIEHYFINEIDRLNKNNFGYFSFVIIAQAIEMLGAALDDKPFRAKNQSRKRFELGIRALFDERYRQLNANGWLYENFRCNMSHLFVPSNAILLLTKKQATENETHLSKKGDTVIFIAEDFQKDLKKACLFFLKKMDKGQIKAKKIGESFENHIL